MKGSDIIKVRGAEMRDVCRSDKRYRRGFDRIDMSGSHMREVRGSDKREVRGSVRYT